MGAVRYATLNAESLSAEEIKLLTALISDLPQTTVLISIIPRLILLMGKNILPQKTKRLQMLFQKVEQSAAFQKHPSELAKDMAAKLINVVVQLQNKMRFILSCRTVSLQIQ
jgi:hypothetical protein